MERESDRDRDSDRLVYSATVGPPHNRIGTGGDGRGEGGGGTRRGHRVTGAGSRGGVTGAWGDLWHGKARGPSQRICIVYAVTGDMVLSRSLTKTRASTTVPTYKNRRALHTPVLDDMSTNIL